MQCSKIWRAYQPVRRMHHVSSSQWSRSRQSARGNPRAHCYRRNFGLQSIPAVLLPPVVFGGLLVTLWAYKCMMMVIFQNKIIYMPSVPPFSRSEKVGDYATQCNPFTWSEADIKAADGTAIKVLESGPNSGQHIKQHQSVVVLYLQGWVSNGIFFFTGRLIETEMHHRYRRVYHICQAY